MKAFFCLIYISLFFLKSSIANDNLDEKNEINAETIAYHIYLAQMASMPRGKQQFHYCKRYNANSPFGTSTTRIVNSSDEERIQSTMKLAEKILSVSRAFGFSTRFEIGYWLGILHRESRFCLNIAGGGISDQNLADKIDTMTGTDAPYVDLGIGQINLSTLTDFLKYRFSVFAKSFDDLAKAGYYKHLDIKSGLELKEKLLKLIPLNSNKDDTNRNNLKKLYSLMIKDTFLNLSFSLPILLDKIHGGININNIRDPNSRLMKYQAKDSSEAFKEFSSNFLNHFNEIEKNNQVVWKRAFGVLTYNGHKVHALGYASDVYCVKSLYDSWLQRSEKTALDFTYLNDEAPFYRFYVQTQTINIATCKEIMRYRDSKTTEILGKRVSLLKSDDFYSKSNESSLTDYESQRQQLIKKGKVYVDSSNPINFNGVFYNYQLVKTSIIDILTTNCFGKYCEVAETIGKEGKIYLYSFVRKVLYPSSDHNLLSDDYNELIKIIQDLNPKLIDNANEISEYGLITFPVLYKLDERTFFDSN